MADRELPSAAAQVRWLRLAGAALYASAVTVLALSSCRAASWFLGPLPAGRTLLLIVSPWNNMLIAAYCMLQCAVVAAHSQLLTATEPRPVALGTAWRPLGRGWLPRTLRGVQGLAARLLAQGRGPRGAQRLVVLLFASVAAGAGCLQLLNAIFSAQGKAVIMAPKETLFIVRYSPATSELEA